ncbi:hypothetical protein [Mycolicibacterium mengxianglii]|uniref:hypothetical protein n=1 Tax=Mycolicibacterium mengxianglii TaxID=2736649 RepID=UPI0018D01AD8|nr:hypothetical protein [Mycolicibacterium mengxianglii]
MTNVLTGLLLSIFWQQKVFWRVAVALNVNIEDVVASGVMVAGHGEDVAMKHCTADHAQRLHTCAQEYCAMEERHAEALKAPGRQADSIASRV